MDGKREFNYELIGEKLYPTLNERYYLEGYDYGIDNISLENLNDVKNNAYFLMGFNDGLLKYYNIIKKR